MCSTFDRSLEILQRLIGFASVSSSSNRHISDAVSEKLESLGFQVEQTAYEGADGVAKVNVVARRDPRRVATADRNENEAGDGLAYFCHTDVVPAAGWTGPGGDPFTAVIRDDRVYGRGSCDMKGSLVAMLAAAEQVSADRQTAPLWIVCTADEEIGFEGAKHMVQESAAYRDIVNAQPLALIGEPTRLQVVHAHKGITALQMVSRGRAAHSSSRDGCNANVAMVPMLETLLEIGERTLSDPQYLDQRFDPPDLSWNFGVSDGCTAVNITPEKSVAWVSLRPMPKIDGEDLVQMISQRAESLGLEFRRLEGGRPFWIDPHSECIRELCRLTGGSSTPVCYGTDGGELDELSRRAVIGPGDIAQAHTTDEWIALEQLERGRDLYASMIRSCCGS